MSKPQSSHRHHYIPQFWINAWRGPDGFVERYMKHANGKIDVLRRPAKSVGYWNGLYSFDIGDSRTINLEDIFFNKIDNLAAIVFEKLCSPNNFQLSGQEPYHLAIFIPDYPLDACMSIALYNGHDEKPFCLS